MIVAVRWVLLLAAVHRQPGGVILAVVVLAIAAERLRAWLWRSRTPAGH